MTADDLQAIELLDDLEDVLASRPEMAELAALMKSHLMSGSKLALKVDEEILSAAREACRLELAQIGNKP